MRGLVAAWLLAAGAAWGGEPTAEVDASGERVVLRGLAPEERGHLLAEPSGMHLGVDGAEGGMPMALHEGPGGALVVEPRFPLMAGVDYALTVERDGASDRLVLSRPLEAGPFATLEAVHPAGIVPENALRLYLRFSRPMARGQVAEAIRLFDEEGSLVEAPFLALGAELWNADQTRLTLMLDPGRIKHGVGPHLALGPPLTAGRRYRLLVSGSMTDAAGRPIGEAQEHRFAAGPAERLAIDPGAWAVRAPAPGTREPLTVIFDRVMDRALAVRAFAPVVASGRPIPGVAQVGDRRWTFRPEAPWPSEPFALRIDAVLEDAAGNRLCGPFDVALGGARHCGEAAVIKIAPLHPLGPSVAIRRHVPPAGHPQTPPKGYLVGQDP